MPPSVLAVAYSRLRLTGETKHSVSMALSRELSAVEAARTPVVTVAAVRAPPRNREEP
jgi:hypothetical protein